MPFRPAKAVAVTPHETMMMDSHNGAPTFIKMRLLGT